MSSRDAMYMSVPAYRLRLWLDHMQASETADPTATWSTMCTGSVIPGRSDLDRVAAIARTPGHFMEATEELFKVWSDTVDKATGEDFPVETEEDAVDTWPEEDSEWGEVKEDEPWGDVQAEPDPEPAPAPAPEPEEKLKKERREVEVDVSAMIGTKDTDSLPHFGLLTFLKAVNITDADVAAALGTSVASVSRRRSGLQAPKALTKDQKAVIGAILDSRQKLLNLSYSALGKL